MKTFEQWADEDHLTTNSLIRELGKRCWEAALANQRAEVPQLGQWNSVEQELARLRDAQSEAVMPMIGPLLDAWENADLDEEPELAKWLASINRAMESAGDEAPSPPAEQQGSSERKPLVTLLDVTLTRKDAERMVACVSGFVSPEDQEPDDEVLRLLIGDGHSGHGIYAAHPEYPEEGAVFVQAVRAEQPRQMVALTPEQIWAAAYPKENSRTFWVVNGHMILHIAEAAIAKFCEVNGITAPGGKG
jgi:hypothetical protein